MNVKLRKFLHTAIFTVCGVAVGYLYYRFMGCGSGSCAISSNPVRSMLYMGLVGWLLSVVFWKDGGKSCNM